MTPWQETAAMRDFSPLYDRFGSWLCENSSGRATRRNISEQLHLWESNHTAQATFDALPENCVFYISRMYEFGLSKCFPVYPRKRTSDLRVNEYTPRGPHLSGPRPAAPQGEPGATAGSAPLLPTPAQWS